MYRHPDSHLYYKDSVHKEWIIEVVGETVLANDILMQDEVSLTDPLCSKDDITLGSCESATLEFKIRNIREINLKNKKLIVSMVLDHHTSTPIPIGEFVVEEDELEDDQRVRKIKAHDKMYEINTKDFAPWFNNLDFTEAMHLKDFRNSFFQYAGIEQEAVELINDWVPLKFQVSNSGATKRMMDEEKEKINQAIAKAEDGTEVIEYEPVDTTDEEKWPPRYETEYDPIYKWEPTYTEIQNIPSGANPKELGWYERSEAGGYVETKDTEAKTGKKYFQIDEPEDYDPEDEGWYAVNKDGGYVLTEDNVPIKNKQYYLADDYEIRSPKEYGWFEQYVDGKGPSTDDTIVEWKHYFEQTKTVPEKPKYVKVITFLEGDSPAEKEWYEYDSETDEYGRSTDSQVDPNKDYFEKVIPKNKNTAFICLTPYIDSHRLDNPKEKGWYELVNDAYVKTEDETIDRSKDYYENIWEINQNEEKDVVEDEILGADIVQAICEINGCFGHIGRDGKFKYVKLKPIDFDDEGLYPAPDLYPDPNLYPQGQPYDEYVDRNKYEDVVRSDYYVKKIDRLVICKEDGDAGYVYPADSVPDNHNTYKITGNFIWYSFTGDRETLDLVGQNLLTQGIAQVSEYTPCEIDMMGNPCLELGDTLKVHTRLGDFYTYVLNRTLSNSQRLVDHITAEGSENRDVGNDLYDAVIALEGKSNILKRTVDETRSEIISVSEGLTSLIKQTAESITLSVSKEVKNANDNVTEKFEAATKYTDSKILDTVSRQAFNDNNDKIGEQFSEFERTYYQISATVESKLDAEGVGNGFKWVLTDSGFVLQSKGGFDLVVNPSPDADPAENEWWKRDTTTHQMIPATEHTVQEGVQYYILRDGTQYRTVFQCTNNGVWVENTVSVDILDVRTNAMMNVVDANTANIRNLVADNITIHADVLDISNDVQTLKTNEIIANMLSATEINAKYITAGTMSAKRLKIDGDLTATIIGGLADASAGSITIGTVRLSELDWYSGPSGYKRVTVRPVIDTEGNRIQALCLT